MTTLERLREPTTLDPIPSTSSFDPSAVPRGPYTFPDQAQVGGWEQLEADDLISLGEERLFSGNKSKSDYKSKSDASLQGEKSIEALGGEEEELNVEEIITSTPVVSEELLGSLGAARRAFLLALTSLLHQYFEDSQGGTPNPDAQRQPFDPAGPSDELFSPLRRHSIATPTVSGPLNPFAAFSPEPDALLSALVSNLRAHAAQPMTSATLRRSLNHSSPFLGNTISSKQALMEELQTRVETIAHELPPTDTQLARALGSLLACIERLVTISRPSQGPSLPQQPVAERGSPNVYLTLEREARALQSNKDQWSSGEADVVVGAAREVEQAERDLLWGRVDDLSEQVGALCRERAATIAAEEAWKRDHSSWIPTERDGSLYEASIFSAADLPQYSNDCAPSAAAHSHLPPAYFTDFASDAKADWEKPPLSPDPVAPSLASPPLRTRTRRISVVHNEKMQRDLDSVSLAIERLYVVSPQLANQRVGPDRRLLRERQLAKLGNAIERLSKGRLDDQRAAPSSTIDEELGMKAARIRRINDAALDRLIDQIDRAASRAMTDQRVDLNGKRREVLNGATHNDDFQPLSDAREAQRREFILEHTGKGRLASQDAVPHTSGVVEPLVSPSQIRNAPISISEFFAEEYSVDSRPRSNSLPGGPLKRRFSTLRLGVFKKGSTPTFSRRGSYDSRTMEKEKGGTPSMSRRGSADSRLEGMTGLGLFGRGMSRTSSSSLDVLAVSALDFIAEESRNLGSLTVTFWPRVLGSTKDEWEVVSVEPEALLIASTKGGPASRLALPCRVIPQAVSVTSHGTFHEAKLITIDPSPTRSRHDLEVHAPLSTAELRECLPTSFACATCHAELVDASRITKYNALPSEHWAELLDAWMCHQDQTLSDDLVAKGKGIKPRVGEGLVGSAYIVFEQDVTKNWVTPEKSESTRSEADDLLHPAHCASCSSLIGQTITSLASTPSSTCFRLLKYASYPTISPRTKNVPRYSLACHLTAEMLEIGQAHACHRFVVEDRETETARLLLWLFNPAVRIAFSALLTSASDLLEDSRSVPSPMTSLSNGGGSANAGCKLIGRTMNVVKIFYTVVSDESDPECQEFISSPHSTSERITYPLEVTKRLTDLLHSSTSIYPPAKRVWGDMEVGFLERI